MKKKLFLLPITLAVLAPMVSMVGCSNPSKPEEETKFTTTTGQMSSATEASFQLDWANGHSLTFASDWAFATNAGTVKSVTAIGGDTRPQVISITFDTEITLADITDGKLSFTYNDLTAKKDNITATIENICITKYIPPEPEQITINLVASIGGSVRMSSYSAAEGTTYADEAKVLLDYQAQPNDYFDFVFWTDKNDNPISEGHIFTNGETITAHFETQQECFEWQINETTDPTVTLVGLTDRSLEMTEILIPSKVFGFNKTYTITSIGNEAFYNCTSLTRIEIPNTVMSIGDSAFKKCTGLTEIEIPDSVESIGDSAFENCRVPTEIDIPDSVESIGDSAFKNCSGLKNVTIGPGVQSIGTSAFAYCGQLANLIIGADVKNIGAQAFISCGRLEEIEIPDSVESIGDYAFSSCEELKKITIGSGVQNIGIRILNLCPKLETIIVDLNNPKYMSQDSDGNQCNCVIEKTETDKILVLGCKNTTISDDVTSIGNSAFSGCRELKNLTIGASVTSIGQSAFAGCNNLEEIEIPNSVKSIGNSAFESCTKLTKIEIPGSVENIDKLAFNSCSKLINLTIGEGVKIIGEHAFRSCTELTTIEIPDSVESIGYGAFNKCTGLKNLTIGAGVTNIDDNAFNDCNNLTEADYKGTVNEWKEIKLGGSYWRPESLKIIHCSDGNITY